MKKVRHWPLFLCLILLVSGCCFVKCPCNGTEFDIAHVNAAGDCLAQTTDDFIVRMYDAQQDTVQDEVNLSNAENCEYRTIPTNASYWIFSSDSLNIADTMTIVAVQIAGPHRCCKACGPYIDNLIIDIDGESFSGNYIQREIP